MPKGRVSVSWSVTDPEANRRVMLTWQEEGGPPVNAPGNLSFGSRLISGSVPYEVGGISILEFKARGVCCRIEIPLRQRSHIEKLELLPSDGGRGG